MSVRTGAATDRGRVRQGNEDNYVSRTHLFAVADGLGGHQAGEVASQIAVDTLAALEDPSGPWGTGPWTDERRATEALRAAIKTANHRIREAAAADRNLECMGTTVTAVLEDGNTLYLAHVGDSRAYLYRNGQLTRLTEDHSLVQQLVNEGRMTPEEAEVHIQKNIITRALGMDSEVEVDTAIYRRRPGDRLMLCTDGLSGVVSEQQMKRVLGRFGDPQEAVEELINQANNEGGPDNITVVVIDTEDGVHVGGDTTELGESGLPPTGESDVMDDVHPVAASRSGRPYRPARRGGRLWRRLITALVGLGVLAGCVFAAQAFLSSRYWVGFDGDEVVVFQGVEGDIAGFDLSRVAERTGIRREQVRPFYDGALTNGVSRDTLDDAVRYARCTPSPLTLEECLSGVPASTTTTTKTTTTAGR
jgi:serine/threonine protein phosphatase PrpC